MNRFRRLTMGMGAGLASLGLVATAPTMAAATTSDAASTQSTPSSTSAAKKPIQVTLASQGGRLDGSATFQPKGEILSAHDLQKDGLGVQAQIRWPGHFRKVNDPNGAASGLGEKNLSIKEGTGVQIRVCVQSYGCTYWQNGTGHA